jgi:hypothetical protein
MGVLIMRITTAHLENLTDWVNAEKGYPREAFKWMASGNYEGQIGHILCKRSSGSWHIEQIVTKGGGVRDLRSGTARECYEFLRGMQEAIMLDHFAERYGVAV